MKLQVSSELIIVFRFFKRRVLIEGVKYNADKPNMIGKTFLRLERDFDKHVTYCRDEPNAQDFLNERDDVRDYFKVLNYPLFIFLSKHLNLKNVTG